MTTRQTPAAVREAVAKALDANVPIGQIDARTRSVIIANVIAALNSCAGDAGEEEGVPKGMKRAYVRCRAHDRIAHYDYVPYSFSTAVAVMPCGCDTKNAEQITRERFLAATAAQTGGKLGWDADGVCDDHYREQCPDCARVPATPAPAVDAVPAGEGDDLDTPEARLEMVRVPLRRIVDDPTHAVAYAKAGLDLIEKTAAERAAIRGEA